MDAKAEELSDAPTNSVKFHRNGRLLLNVGFGSRLRFFQVNLLKIAILAGGGSLLHFLFG